MPASEQAEAEQLRRVLAEVQAANERLAAQREERRRAAQDLLAKSQVGCVWMQQLGLAVRRCSSLGERWWTGVGWLRCGYKGECRMPRRLLQFILTLIPLLRSAVLYPRAAAGGAAGGGARVQQGVGQPRGGAGGLRQRWFGSWQAHVLLCTTAGHLGVLCSCLLANASMFAHVTSLTDCCRLLTAVKCLVSVLLEQAGPQSVL